MKINIRVCINFIDKEFYQSSTEIIFFRYDKQGDTQIISHNEFRQLVLQHGSDVHIETSFGDGYETNGSQPLIDVLGETRPVLYARREEKTDIKNSFIYDIVLYRDREATQPFGRSTFENCLFDYASHSSKDFPVNDAPNYINICGHNYYLFWLTDLIKQPQ